MFKLTNTYRIAFLFLMLIFAAGCNWNVDKSKLAKTTVRFNDSTRHYFPIPQGKKLTATYRFFNTGQKPLAIIDVQTSCGCALAEYSDRLIQPEGEGTIVIEYNSDKNLGFTEIFTTVIANTEPSMHTLHFDVNVVPDALYVKDYEEIFYKEEKKKKGGVKELVDGDETQQGYYTDSSFARQFD
ncbi:MAG: DUF1573 domain-containing protein [Chitinophagaceae bacterium]|nr:DUF1573 domain-containing protein [Chitinophagaceae bacterium]